MYKIYTHKPGVPKRYVHKFLLVMKLTMLILIAAMMQVSAATYAQRITLKEKEANLETVFKEIRKQSGYDFYFDQHVIQKARPVNVDLKDVSLEEALKSCLADQPLTYSIEEKTIVIKEKEPSFFDKIKKALMPPADVIGRVTNTQGQPLNGATVTVKRTQTGTLTDANGNFTVRGVLSSDTIVVSYLGYKRQSIPVGEQKEFKVMLEETSNQLDQVVVQAYGETSQRLTTGDIGKVTAEQIARQPVVNVLDAIQGQIAGVVVTNTGGYASGAVKVEIRGRNIIGNFPSDPLYIIDGIPLTILDVSNRGSYDYGSRGSILSNLSSPAGGQSPFFNINPSDIESIEVLKDADATAIYGSRGANGVILITTKKGKAGKAHFDVNMYEGMSKITRNYNMLNTQQYLTMRREALKNDGLTPNKYNAPDLVNWDTTRYTNWQKYLYGGIGKTTDIQASISGGDASTTFRIGGGYTYQTDILAVNGDNERGSLSFSLTHKDLNDRFQISLNANYSYSFINEIYQPIAATLPPDAPPIYDSKGNINYGGWAPVQYTNPFGSLLQPYTSKTNFLNSNLVVSYQVLKGLIFKTNIGYNVGQTNQINSIPIVSQDPEFNPTGSSYFGYNNFHNLISEPQIEYNSFISKGKLNLLLGASYQINNSDGLTLTGLGYKNDALLNTISNAPSQITTDNFGEYKYSAIFGRVNYNWENKYIINLNLRRDGSSKFGPGRQFGNFGSVGAAWIFTEENGIKGKSFLSFGKIKASYGTTGNDQILNYQYLTKWSSAGALSYNNVLPYLPQGHTDSLLHWQVNKKTEAALDLGFFKDRITLEIAFYLNRCNDQLILYPTPAFTGFTSVTANSPADVQNMGWEFTGNFIIIDNKDFRWSSKFNIGFNHNKLLSYPNLSQSPFADTYVIGQSLNVKKLLHFTGVDSKTGLYAFQDKNNDGKISLDFTDKTSDDRYTYDLSPKFDGQFATTFNFKNWELSCSFYFRNQKAINALAVIDVPGDMSNQPVQVLQRWQKVGDITNVARLTTNPSDPSYTNFQFYSDGVYTDASFIRLQNVYLSYILPKRYIRNGTFKFFLKGENLFVLTRYKGVDPEIHSFGYPALPAILTGGISCNF